MVVRVGTFRYTIVGQRLFFRVVGRGAHHGFFGAIACFTTSVATIETCETVVFGFACATFFGGFVLLF